MNCAIRSEENTAQGELVQSSKENDLKVSETYERPNEHFCVDSWKWTDHP